MNGIVTIILGTEEEQDSLVRVLPRIMKSNYITEKSKMRNGSVIKNGPGVITIAKKKDLGIIPVIVKGADVSHYKVLEKEYGIEIVDIEEEEDGRQ